MWTMHKNRNYVCHYVQIVSGDLRQVKILSLESAGKISDNEQFIYLVPVEFLLSDEFLYPLNFCMVKYYSASYR